MRGKINIKKYGGQKHKINVKFLAIAVAVMFSTWNVRINVNAESCPDLKVVFARGSGGELNRDQNYLAFKTAVEEKLKATLLKYEFIDLDYPAVGVGLDNLKVTLGAYIGAGETYEFGESVKSGVKKLDNIVNDSACPDTKYVLGGYSQGAMVISKTLPSLNADRIIYVATFGDPKLYLPEGEGLIPSACSGKNLSDYRMYVPDCHAYKGLLGAYIPYEPEAYLGKLGTWCNKNDIFCSSHFNINDHVSYVSDNLYEDASRVIMDKVARYFKIENHYYSPHDTAIVIDSTGSMASLIDKYKAEAFRLAKETLDSGGRVALYDYRDLDDPYQPVERCNFETCTIESFTKGLEEITVDGGGDDEESLLSAAFHVMQKLNWRRGATKSLVVLTDAGFLSPDRDGISYAEAVRLSKTIDPVNFYIITEPGNEEQYQKLANDTDGMVVTDSERFSLLTDYITSRYDSLPRVEEDDNLIDSPTLSVKSVEAEGGDATISFTTNAKNTVVILDDAILGTTTKNTITLNAMTPHEDHILTLVPLNDNLRGEGVSVAITLRPAIKAPNTGRR